MSLIQFESHYYYFTAGTILILFFVVRFLENFHHGHPTPGSFYSTRDEPIANKFIFAYGLASVPYAFLLLSVITFVAFLFTYGIQVVVLGIVVFLGGDGFTIFTFDVSNILGYLAPWQMSGFSGYEIIGFGLAGYRMGYYSEETKRKAYYNSILVYLVYFSIFVWGVAGLESSPSNSVFYSVIYEYTEILLFLAVDLVVILVMTWFGNSRSIALDEGDDVSILPSVKGYMQIVYMVTLFMTLISLIISTSFISILKDFGLIDIGFTLSIDEYIMIICFFAIIAVIFIYSIISIIQGDISRIIILLDENDMLIENDENQKFKNPKFLSIFTIFMLVISIASLYFLPLS